MTQKSEPPRYQELRIGRAVTSKGLEIYMVVRMPVEAKAERSAWWPRIVRASRAAIALARREM
jgi:hypothetical protein